MMDEKRLADISKRLERACPGREDAVELLALLREALKERDSLAKCACCSLSLEAVCDGCVTGLQRLVARLERRHQESLQGPRHEIDALKHRIAELTALLDQKNNALDRFHEQGS